MRRNSTLNDSKGQTIGAGCSKKIATYDPVGIFGRQLGNRGSNNRGLTPRIMRIYGIRTRLRLQIIGAAQEIVRMVVDFVRRALGQDGRPASGNLEIIVTEFQEALYARDRMIDAANQILKFIAPMQRLPGLPPLTRQQVGAL